MADIKATPVGLASYPSLAKPKENPWNDNAKYEITLLWDKGTDLSVLEEQIEKAIVKRWGDKRPRVIASPIKDGDEKYEQAENPKSYEQYRGKMFATFKRDGEEEPAPCFGAKGPDGTYQVLNPRDIEGGNECRVAFRAATYDVSGNRGANLYFHKVQKLGEGTPFVAAEPTAEEVFGDQITSDDLF